MRVTGVTNTRSLSSSFTRHVRHQSIFGVSEICKGILIFGVGDMAIADQFGEVVVVAWQGVGIYPLASIVAWGQAL